MRRYTTPTMTLRVPLDIADHDIYVTFEQGCTELTKSGNDVTAVYDSELEKTVLTVSLTQAETAAFRASRGKDCVIQVNWITSGGYRDATKPKAVRVSENFLDREVEYGN